MENIFEIRYTIGIIVQRIFCGESECTFRDDELWIPVSGAAVPAATWHLVLHAFCDRLHGGCVLEED